MENNFQENFEAVNDKKLPKVQSNYEEMTESEGYNNIMENENYMELRRFIVENAPENHFKEGDKVRSKVIGSGGRAIVFKAHSTSDTKKHVVLKANKVSCNYKDIQGEELYANSNIDNPNLAKVYKCDMDSRKVLMQYYPGEDLSKILSNEQDFNKHDLLIANLLNALKSLHENKLIHDDIKPENIILTHENNNERFVVCDFGSIRKISPKYSLRFDKGSLLYEPPEAINRTLFYRYSNANPKTDIWSAGIVFYMAFTGYKNYCEDFFVNILRVLSNDTEGEKFEYLQEEINKRIDNIDPKYDKYKDLLKNMLKIKQEERYTIDQCLENLQKQNNEKSFKNQLSRSSSNKTVSSSLYHYC